MDTYNIENGLPNGQKELLRVGYKLAIDKKGYKRIFQGTSFEVLGWMDKYAPDTKIKKWVYVLMRTLFIDSFRRIVCEQIFADRTDSYYTLDIS